MCKLVRSSFVSIPLMGSWFSSSIEHLFSQTSLIREHFIGKLSLQGALLLCLDRSDIRLIKDVLPCGQRVGKSHAEREEFLLLIEQSAASLGCNPQRVVKMFSTKHDYHHYELGAFNKCKHHDFLAFVCVDGVMLRKWRPELKIFEYIPVLAILYDLCLHRLASIAFLSRRCELRTTKTVTHRGVPILYQSMKKTDALAVAEGGHLKILFSFKKPAHKDFRGLIRLFVEDDDSFEIPSRDDIELTGVKHLSAFLEEQLSDSTNQVHRSFEFKKGDLVKVSIENGMQVPAFVVKSDGEWIFVVLSSRHNDSNMEILTCFRPESIITCFNQPAFVRWRKPEHR
jgi:hypothetical protein